MLIKFMEQKFKEALQNHYRLKLTKSPAREYRDHLYPLGWSYRSLKKIPIAKKELSKHSEKASVINSLKDFSEDLLNKSQSESGSIRLDKIEISKKENRLDQYKVESFSREYVEKETCKASYDARYSKLDSLDQVEVIFVADTLYSKFEDDPEDLVEFMALFDRATAELFSKMVKAMKLSPSNYLLTAISFEKEGKKSVLPVVLSEIEHFQPKIVISLGVSASHALIDTNQRLKDLHGNFYPINIRGLEVEVMPLFSPNLLNSAPHMKSITWIDMQKAMERLQ